MMIFWSREWYTFINNSRIWSRFDLALSTRSFKYLQHSSMRDCLACKLVSTFRFLQSAPTNMLVCINDLAWLTTCLSAKEKIPRKPACLRYDKKNLEYVNLINPHRDRVTVLLYTLYRSPVLVTERRLPGLCLVLDYLFKNNIFYQTHECYEYKSDEWWTILLFFITKPSIRWVGDMP